MLLRGLLWLTERETVAVACGRVRTPGRARRRPSSPIAAIALTTLTRHSAESLLLAFQSSRYQAISSTFPSISLNLVLLLCVPRRRHRHEPASIPSRHAPDHERRVAERDRHARVHRRREPVPAPLDRCQDRETAKGTPCQRALLVVKEAAGDRTDRWMSSKGACQSRNTIWCAYHA